MRWIEKLEENAKIQPQSTAIVDAGSGVSISYQKLEELSGKIYHALKKDGIGKEDVVMICLPRGCYPFVCALGVWKAGAAVLFVEVTSSKKQRDKIYQNTSSTYLIDSEKYKEMIRETYEEGHRETDLHDMAYLIYTSGTTAFPKVVIHEYGSMDLCVAAANCQGRALFEKEDRFAFMVSLRFAATFLLTIPLFYEGATLVVIPLEEQMNASIITRSIKDYRVTSGFFTPSVLKMFREFPSGFCKLMVAAEPVRNIYYEGIRTYNLYGQSESGYYCCAFLIDRAYKITPIGLPHWKGCGLCILDEEGNVVDPGQKGEICYKNPYFRGYFGMPEKTKAILRDGLIHSGDVGKYLTNGNIVLTGRLDHMVKIHGNRVEIEEIEEILCDLLKLSWIGIHMTKIRKKEYLYACYLQEEKICLDNVREILLKKIPAYMIPAFFLPIEEIPKNVNGKFDRKALPLPIVEDYQEDYIHPVGQLEQELCDVMSRVLGVPILGAKDNFYRLGGDSISTMEVLAELNWPYLDISMIYDGQTPRNIASIYKKMLGGRHWNLDERNENALKKGQLLSATQTYMLHAQSLLDHSTMWNMPLCLQLGDQIDFKQFRQAVLETMICHPVFATRYQIAGNAKCIQIYDPTILNLPEIRFLTEKEFETIKPHLIQPFEIIGQPLYRVQFFETEGAKYVFMDFHHSIVDGTSLHIIVDDIFKAYEGHSLDKDYYYLYLEEELQEKKSSRYDEGQAYFSNLLDGEEWSCYPKEDFQRNDHSYGNVTTTIPLQASFYQRLKEVYGMSKNAFFIAVSILTIAAYNDVRKVRISWVFNGRKKKIAEHVVGSLIQDCYVGMIIEDDLTLEEFYDEIQEQIQMDLYYSCYNYPGPERMIQEGEDASLLYQSGLRSFREYRQDLFTEVELPGKPGFADNILDMEILDNENYCVLYMDYIASMYKKESMERFAHYFVTMAKGLANHVDEAEFKVSSLLKMSFLDIS